MNVLRQIFVSNLCKGFTSNTLRSAACENLLQCRTLYSPATLGVDQYVKIREKTVLHFGNAEERFRSKMVEFSDASSQHMIFTEDLKSMVHLVENTDEDMATIEAMMRKFNQQNKEVRFGSFIFGPVIMRMYHYLNRPAEALAVYNDPELTTLFDQLISYQILMDLLFRNEMYHEVLEVFSTIRDRQVQGNRYPKNAVVLCMGACYRINTPESYKVATELWGDMKEVGHLPMRRATTFAAMLALNQNEPHVALEILSNEAKQSYITVRNIKAAALSELGRAEDVIPLLRSVLQNDDAFSRKHTFTPDTMDRIRKAMANCADGDVKTEFERVDKQLQGHELICGETLDYHLMREIEGQGNTNIPQTRILAQSYNRRGSFAGQGGGSTYRQRPGLAELS